MEMDIKNHCTISPQYAFRSRFQQGKCCFVDVVKCQGNKVYSINY